MRKRDQGCAAFQNLTICRSMYINDVCLTSLFFIFNYTVDFYINSLHVELFHCSASYLKPVMQMVLK